MEIGLRYMYTCFDANSFWNNDYPFAFSPAFRCLRDSMPFYTILHNSAQNSARHTVQRFAQKRVEERSQGLGYGEERRNKRTSWSKLIKIDFKYA